ncbi:MAG TPA: hypothetical protein VLC98_03885 [Phnomibacter sp.]|nr:hypothetical protein [Phnomibacter sp.]
MSRQNPVTLITPVKFSKQASLFEFLYQLRIDLEKDIHESFENIGTIHYARWLVIDDTISPGTSSMGDMPKLVYSANIDGDPGKHIEDLCTIAGDVIDKIYDCCEGYPSSASPEMKIAYLKKWAVPVSAFYIGSPGRSLPQIQQESQLRNFIRNFLDSKNWNGRSSQQVHAEIQKAVFANPEFEWAKKPAPTPSINWPGLVLMGIVLLLLLPVILVWILVVQFKYERHDSYFTLKRSELDENAIRKLETYEDLDFQNQFSQLVVMKAGKVRLITYNSMMLFARVLIRNLFVKGKLMGIPSIHFARWVLFDNKKRVLFFSNFDGSWQQYLGDFIDKSGWGLTGIFSNTTNFPKTKFLIMGGAYDEEHFLAWSRHSEIQTQIWYNAYPQLSIKNINNNSIIRNGLSKQLSAAQAATFLKLL